MLWFWFAINWSTDIRRRVKLNSRHPDYIHINCLEFLIVVLQLAAAITRLEDQPRASLPPALLAQFPAGFPHIPTLLTWTDNTPSKKWANKVTTAPPVDSTSSKSMPSSSADATSALTATGSKASQMFTPTKSHVRFPLFPTLTIANRSFRQYQKRPPGIISDQRPHFSRSWHPDYHALHGRTTPSCQRNSDDSKPPDPLFPLLP